MHTSPHPWRLARPVLAPLVTLALVGCAAGPADAPATGPIADRPVVLATFTVLADIARNVAGEELEVRSIVRPGAEVHGYEPTPSDVRAAAGADLILAGGLGLEVWFEQFVHDADVPRVVVSEDVGPIDIAADTHAGQPNPHAWMSPANVRLYVDTIADAFGELLPDRAELFAANAAAYRAELHRVEDDLVGGLAVLPADQRALVTCEGAFSYLARDVGLTEVYLWPVNAEQQASPRQVARVIEFVRTHDVPAVFCESTVPDAPMQQVVAATDARFGGLLYVDSLSEADGPVPTYLDLLRHDAEVIVRGLTGQEP